MPTKIIDCIPLSAEKFNLYKKSINNTNILIDQLSEKFKSFNRICEHFDQLFSNNHWVIMDNKPVVYIHKIASIIPNLSSASLFICCENKTYKPDLNKLNFSGFSGTLPSRNEAKVFDNSPLFMDKEGYILYNSVCYPGISFEENGKYWYRYVYGPYRGKESRHGNNIHGSMMLSIPIFRFNAIDSEEISAAKAILYWLKNSLIPKDSEFYPGGKEDFILLQKEYEICSDFITDLDNKIVLDKNKVIQELNSGKELNFLPKNNIDDLKIIDCDFDYEKNFINELLQCDYKRAELDIYDENILHDPNRGHWDLWDMDSDFEKVSDIKLFTPLVARDPASDINDGIVGIDFGTKSTIVVYQNENMQIIPIQVGSGKHIDSIDVKKYENPTIIQFIDLDGFLKAYNARIGRPYTSWEQITVSHTAEENLNDSDSQNYHSFFEDIKHWCGTQYFNLKLKDGNGRIIDIPPYMDLKENDFDPLEIYAYYLGIYINNMSKTKRIFFNYLLSFPISYEVEIRERLRRSFEAGLKKSLPPALLRNKAVMSKFSVKLGESEPGAYAITAIKEYGFHPKDNETNYYAVFDFGGGTTDFDFGLIRKSEFDRYDYTLLHFGEHGDRTLGGENLLRLLAFKVFKQNWQMLLSFPGDEERPSKIPFTWAADKEDFAGSEALINDSQEAYMNMHNLMEKLRPFWEDPDSAEVKDIIDRGYIEVDLFDESGYMKSRVHLNITHESPEADSVIDDDDLYANFWLFKILDQRIENGIKNFFIAMRLAFENVPNREKNKIPLLAEITEMSIFLAGNSCRSKRVTAIFERYIGQLKLAYPLLGLADENVDISFLLYPALGTDAAFKKLKALHEQYPNYVNMPSKDRLEAPTGKTGVAYGLLYCRQGGNYNVMHLAATGEETSFQFYVGRYKLNLFKPVIDRSTPLGKWFDFIDARADFDILYTDLPEAALGNLPVQKVRRIPINLSKPNPSARIFIRAVKSRTIECAVAKSIDELLSRGRRKKPLFIDLDMNSTSAVVLWGDKNSCHVRGSLSNSSVSEDADNQKASLLDIFSRGFITTRNNRSSVFYPNPKTNERILALVPQSKDKKEEVTPFKNILDVQTTKIDNINENLISLQKEFYNYKLSFNNQSYDIFDDQYGLEHSETIEDKHYNVGIQDNNGYTLTYKNLLDIKKSEIYNLNRKLNYLNKEYHAYEISLNNIIERLGDLDKSYNNEIYIELEHFKKLYASIDLIYSKYSSLTINYGLDLQDIFGKADSPEVFLCHALQNKNIISLYEYLYQGLNNKKFTEQEISIFNEIIDFIFDILNRSSGEARYERLEVKVGSDFDQKYMQKILSSPEFGKVKTILFQGFAYTKSPDPMFKSLIELDI